MSHVPLTNIFQGIGLRCWEQWRSKGGGEGEGGRHLGQYLYGGDIELQMYFYYTNRGVHIYLAPDGNTPWSANGWEMYSFKTLEEYNNIKIEC